MAVLVRRIRTLRIAMCAGMAVLVATLFITQVVMGPQYAQEALDARIRTLSVRTARGQLTDRYGRILAGTQTQYALMLSISEAESGKLNDSICAALAILRSYQASLSCEIPIEADGDSYRYTEEDVQDFLTALKLPSDTAAPDAVAQLVQKYGAQQVPKSLLLPLLAVRVQGTAQGYRAYTPIELGVTEDSAICAKVMENSALLSGISVEQVPVRTYPNGSLLCHVLGYMGKISREDAEIYTQKGYDLSRDTVGKSGLEATLEDVLHPVSGERTVSIDSSGNITHVLSETPGHDGQDVVLTVDARLQEVAEDALTSTMAQIRSGAMGEAFPNAQIGAAVALDVTTGEVLAMASVPGYDPNVFLKPLSEQTWQSLNPTYTQADGQADRNPTLPRPLVNNAITNAFAPGSVFKPITALAALEAGVVTPTETILDQGRYTRFSQTQAPACWTWNESSTTHGLVDLDAALSGSCNYYFYELGYRTGSARLRAMAQKLGLGQKSGLPLLGEAAGVIDSVEEADALARTRAVSRICACCSSVSEAQAGALADALLEDPSLPHCQALLSPLGMDDAQIQSVYNLLDTLRWRESRILASAIGQGDNTTTVLQMANALAAITQNGRRYTPQLVLSYPDSTGEVAPEVACEAFLPSSTVQAVCRGLRDVTQSGTARRYFTDCPISIAAKTGTAQSQGRDAFAWFIAYAPFEDPRIAVAVMIGQGGHGAYAAPVARAIIEAYFAPGEGTAVVRERELLP